MQKLNLNSSIKVKLTDRGKDIFYRQHDDFIRRYPCAKHLLASEMPVIDEEGYTTFQLWVFMELYGPHMTMGSQSVIMNNDLYIPDKMLRTMDEWKKEENYGIHIQTWR